MDSPTADCQDISLTGSNMALVVATDSKLEEEDSVDEGRVKDKDSVEDPRQRTRGRMGKLLRHKHNARLPRLALCFCFGLVLLLVLFLQAHFPPHLDALMRHVAIRVAGDGYHGDALDLYNNPGVDFHATMSHIGCPAH